MSTLNLQEFYLAFAEKTKNDRYYYHRKAHDLTCGVLGFFFSFITRDGAFAYSVSLHELVPDFDEITFALESEKTIYYEQEYYLAVTNYARKHCILINIFASLNLDRQLWQEALDFFRTATADPNSAISVYHDFSHYYYLASMHSREIAAAKLRRHGGRLPIVPKD